MQIVLVEESQLAEDTGMGRVSCHWKLAFERAGHELVHIGPTETGKVRHPRLFPPMAKQVFNDLGIRPDLLLVHEPAVAAFADQTAPLVAVSHGLERRNWNSTVRPTVNRTVTTSLKTRLLFPFWRLRGCDLGMRRAELLLLINTDDARFAEEYYRREASDIFVFQNGVNRLHLNEFSPGDFSTILFLGTWQERKGTQVLVKAATQLWKDGVRPKWLLAGTGNIPKDEILSQWPPEVREYVEIIPKFSPLEEEAILARGPLLVQPSYFEGQSLALLQAMAGGRCCIASNCCGQKDLIQDGFNGILHEPGDHQGLASAVARCMQDPSMVERLGKSARESVETRGWESVSDEVCRQLENVTRKRREFVR